MNNYKYSQTGKIIKDVLRRLTPRALPSATASERVFARATGTAPPSIKQPPSFTEWLQSAKGQLSQEATKSRLPKMPEPELPIVFGKPLKKKPGESKKSFNLKLQEYLDKNAKPENWEQFKKQVRQKNAEATAYRFQMMPEDYEREKKKLLAQKDRKQLKQDLEQKKAETDKLANLFAKKAIKENWEVEQFFNHMNNLGLEKEAAAKYLIKNSIIGSLWQGAKKIKDMASIMKGMWGAGKSVGTAVGSVPGKLGLGEKAVNLAKRIGRPISAAIEPFLHPETGIGKGLHYLTMAPLAAGAGTAAGLGGAAYGLGKQIVKPIAKDIGTIMRRPLFGESGTLGAPGPISYLFAGAFPGIEFSKAFGSKRLVQGLNLPPGYPR